MLIRTQAPIADRSKNLVGFVVDSVHYALDIHAVQEIISPLDVVALPDAPEAVIGVADHRGDVIPVIDLRLRFRLPPAELPRRKWLVAGTQRGAVGLCVDRVTDVFSAERSDLGAVPGRLDERGRGIKSVCRRDGALVFVLDVDHLAEPSAHIDLPGAMT